MRRICALLVGCMLLAGAAPAVQGQPTPVAVPYDVRADASAQVARAFADAKGSGRLVLLDFGGNWCPDCRMLAGVMAMPTAKPWLDKHFATVLIDVGRFDRNLGIARRYGVTIKAVPTVLVLTAGGKLLDPDGTKTLANARAMSAQSMIDLLATWDARQGGA